MSAGELLEIEPAELKFPFELRKQITCSLQLSNKSDDHIAFKVKTTNPKKYCVRPNNGIVLPRSTCDVAVTMQAQREAPIDIQCKDKFLVQSAVVEPGTLAKDITAEMFSRESGNKVDDVKLRVVYVSPPQPPSPVHEGSDEGSSPRASLSETNNAETSEPAVQARAYATDQEENYPEAKTLASKLTEEKNTAVQQSLMEEKNVAIQQGNKLREEIELLRLELSKKKSSGSFSFIFVVIMALLGVIVGYLLKA
ncbi:vesicle-associated protein 1-2-like [Phalaenopsis equestris]|uniref:vesicle-associated protein 1-2-like n=1 Tax=Phalaenopsis equestris TaxID=78828 RepID=UPI0009E500DF|nr:vesicle-associated protein 1-2-like [Phalaenopsis equestris]